MKNILIFLVSLLFVGAVYGQTSVDPTRVDLPYEGSYKNYTGVSTDRLIVGDSIWNFEVWNRSVTTSSPEVRLAVNKLSGTVATDSVKVYLQSKVSIWDSYATVATATWYQSVDTVIKFTSVTKSNSRFWNTQISASGDSVLLEVETISMTFTE